MNPDRDHDYAPDWDLEAHYEDKYGDTSDPYDELWYGDDDRPLSDDDTCEECGEPLDTPEPIIYCSRCMGDAE